MNLREEWSAITGSPKYLSMTDSDREQIRQEFYESRIAPNLMPYEQEQARQLFDTFTAPQGDPSSGMLNDLRLAFQSGVAGGFADLAQGATLGHSNVVSDWLRERADDYTLAMSPSMIEDISNTGFTYSKEEGVGLKEGSTLRGAAGLFFQGGGSLFPSMVPGMAAGKALSMAGRGLAGTRTALSAATQARNASLANQAYSRARLIDSTASATGFGLVGGAMMTGGVANQAYEEVMNLPQETLDDLEPYQRHFVELRSQGLTDDEAAQQAKEAVAQEASRANLGKAGVIGFLSSALTGPIEARLLTGAGGATRASNIARGMATEMAQESVESSAQPYLSNLSVASVGVDRDPWQGVVGETLTGMAIGGGIGGLLGGVSKPNPPKSRETLSQEYEGFKVLEQQLVRKLDDPKLDDVERNKLEVQLGEVYRGLYDINEQRKKAPTLEQLGESQNNETPTPAAETPPVETPDRRDYVPHDVVEQLADAERAHRKINSDYARAMGNKGQGDAETAQQFENDLKASGKTIDLLKLLQANIRNQQYFPTQQDFDQYIHRKLNGGLDGRLADIELEARKANRSVDEAVANYQAAEQLRQSRQAGPAPTMPMRPMVAAEYRPGMREAVKEPPPKPKPAPEPKTAPSQQKAPVQPRTDIQQLKAIPSDYSQHGQVRRILSDLATHGNARIHYGDNQTLTIRSGKADPGQLQQYLAYTRKAVARERQQQQRGGALAGVERMLRRSLENYPKGDVQAWKIRSALNAIDEGKTRRIPYGDNQVLQITKGRYGRKAFGEFAQHMARAAKQGERKAPAAKPGKATGKGQPTQKRPTRQEKLSKRADLYDQLRGLPAAARQDWKYQNVVNALENRGSTRLHYGAGQEVNIRKGLYDPREMQAFIAHMQQQGEAAELRQTQEPPPTPKEKPKAGKQSIPEPVPPPPPETPPEPSKAPPSAKPSEEVSTKPEKVSTSEKPVKKTPESIQVPAESLDPKELVNDVNQIVFDNMPADLRKETKPSDYRGFSQTLTKAIVYKDVDQLLGILDQGAKSNPGSKKAFQWATGQEGIGMTAKANRQAVYDWVGLSAEQVEARRKEREQKLAQRIAERKRQDAITAAENVPLTIDGQPGTLKQWVDNLIDQGATELKKSDDRIPRYWLVDPKTNRGADLSSLGRQKGGKGVAKVAKDYAEVALADLQNKPAEPQPSNNQQTAPPETPTVAEPEQAKPAEPIKKIPEPQWWTEMTPSDRVNRGKASGVNITGSTPWNRLTANSQHKMNEQWGPKPEAPPKVVPETATIAAEATQESTDERATDHRGHPEGTEPAEVPATEGERPAAGPDVGLPGATEPGLGAGSRAGTQERTKEPAAERPGTDQPVDATGLPVSEGDRAGPDHRGTDAPVRSEDYRITDHSLAIERSWPQKAADNIAAIRILKQLARENRNARPDEQAVLVRYVGWGASDLANNMFPVKGRELSPQWQALSDELRSLLSNNEWKEAQRSVNYAHFTGANIIDTLYKAAERFGVKSGLTLEGGMGIGHFTGLMPDSLHLQFTGVEMDPVSALIANTLYPSHEVLQGDFTRIGFPDNHFDFTLGNPPYINQAVKSDPKYFNKGFMLHDYFIAKQIDALKPGGIGVFVTSSKTLDKKGQEFRQHVGDQAYLLGAIRLPNTAFAQNSGTSVVTDLLFFQKKGEGVKPVDNDWFALGDHPVLKDEGNYDEHGNVPPIEINQYFLDNPQMVLGNETMAGGRWGSEYTVEPGLKKKKGESQSDYLKRADAWLNKALNKALKQLPRKRVKDNPTPEQMAEQAAQYDFNPKDKEDSFYIREDGSIGQVIDGYGQSVPVRGGGSRSGLSKKQQQYVRDYIPLREAVMAVYRQQYGNDADWQAAVTALEQEYNAFVAQHGPFNQGTVRTINYKDGRPPVEQTVEPIVSTLDMDPEAFRVAAIEHYDISTGEASKSRIFSERVLNVQPEPAIESAMDAVAATLNEKGYLDMERVQQLYPDLPMADVVSELGDAIFLDPASNQYVIHDDYLSGNVKAKLQDARNKAKEDPAFQRNVKALEAVIPEDLPVASVPMNLGSFWIPESVVKQFAREEMGFGQVTVNKFRHRELSSWNVSGHADVSRYATQRKSATDILEAALNQKTLLIRDNVGTSEQPVYKTNDKETAAANAKRQELKDAFERWARQNGKVADQLTQIYNRDYNTSVPRKNDGSHLTFPGLSSKYQLRPHQADVVWRILQMGNTYMAHAVGAGKTLASIVTAMELKRLGIANKPTFAVLKSTLRQFAAEFLDAYPNANILVADEKQLDKKNRRRFLAKVANENWDAVIMTHESFSAVPMSDRFIEEHINRQIEELDTLLDSLDDDEFMTRKEIENRKGNLEQKLKKLAEAAVSRKDRGLSFEETGIDYLFIDEAHQHKKVGFPTQQSNLKGVDSATSNRAADLFMKTQYLETVRPGKHTVLMSGTPVSNTMGELYNIQRYLQPRVLEANQISSFDAWTAAFADTTTNIEMQPDGSFKPTTRLTRFVGVPGLMRDVLQVMDYVGMGQMREQGLVKLPKVDKGLKVTPKAPELAAYQKELGDRIRAFEALTGREKKAKGVDAIVKILGDGRKAAIDMRMVNRTQEGPSKLDNMIDNVFDHYQQTRDNTYLDKEGNADPVKGGIQLIFSDAVNAYDRPGGQITFSIYQHIKDTLVSRGVPADEIAFIGDYSNSLKKKRLFNDVNAGRKTILIGGSDNLGTGVNVQKRLTALHNLDINYVPAKMDQRTGRGERQGNQNPEIDNFLYVTEGTTDATVLQMNENKTRMADQVLRGDFSVHSMEDTSNAADDLAQAKAIASGNPLLLEQASVNADVRRLAAMRDAHINKLADYRQKILHDTQTLESYERSLPDFENIASQYVSTRSDAFRATVNGQRFDKRKDTGEALLRQLQASLTDRNPNPRKIGSLGGYELAVNYSNLNNAAQLAFQAQGNLYPITTYQDGDHLTPVGLVTKAENQAAHLSTLPEKTRNNIESLKEDIGRYRKGLEEKFPYEEQLQKQQERLDAINAELKGSEEADTGPVTEAETEPPAGTSRYRLTDSPPPSKPYRTKSLASQLSQKVGDIATVVHYESDLPSHLQRQIEADGVSGRVKGVYDLRTGEVYVIARNTDNLADGIRTALHESVGHKGLRAVLGDAINRTLDQIYQSLSPSQKADLRREYINQIAGKPREEQRRIVAEEYLAHLAETDPQNSWLQKAIARIRRWLRQRFPSLAWNPSDIRQLIMDASQKVKDDRRRAMESARYQLDKDAVDNNIQQGLSALTQVLKTHQDAVSAMYRPDVGDIDLVWGSEGKWPPKKSGVRKGAKGLAHIIEARMRKDGLSRKQAENILQTLVKVIAKGTEIDRQTGYDQKRGKNVENIRLQHDNHIVTLVSEDVGQSNHYMLTGYELKDSASGETGKAYVNASPTHSRPTLSRPEVGAEAESTVQDTRAEKQDTPDGARYKLDALSKLDSQQVKQEIGASARSMKEAVRAKALGFLGGRQITEIYRKVFDALVVKDEHGNVIRRNPLQIIGDLTQALSATRNEYANKADKVDQKWSKLAGDKHAYQLTADTMHQSTLLKQDPSLKDKDGNYLYVPLHDKRELQDQLRSAIEADDRKAIEDINQKLDEEQQRQQDYRELRKMYDGMGELGQEIYNEVRDYYQNMWEAQKQALKDRVDGMEMDPDATGKIKAQIEDMFHRNITDGPYFPLMRFGDFGVVATTPDGQPYREHFESQKDLEAGIRELESQGYIIESSGKNLQFEPRQMSGVTEFSGKIFKALTSEKMEQIDMDAKMAFMDEVNQIALSLLPELSAAKRSMHRKGIAGFDTNARRAFASTALHGANRLGRTRYGWQIESELKRMDKATDAGQYSVLDETPEDKIIGRAVAEEMRRRHDLNMNPNGHPLAANITNAAFLWYLGGSAAAGLVNLTQNILVALPQLGSRYGYTKASRIMAGAARDYLTLGKRKLNGVDDFLGNAWYSLEDAKANKRISQDEIDMINALIKDGTIDITQAHTLANLAGTDLRPEAQKSRDWYTKMMRASGMFFHNAEVANRQIAALTAYRLYKQEAAKSGKPFNAEAAVDYTRNAVFNAHFDYSSFNRPRHFKGNWAKVFLIFKQHSQNMSYILGKNFYDGVIDQKLKGTEEGRQQVAMARRALIGTLGLHALFAGVMGLPGMSVMLWAAGKAMGDEDDPVNPEVELRNFFADLFGAQNGHALAKGVFNGYLGIDLHQRTKLNDLWISSPNHDMPARQEAQHYVANGIGGPAVSQLINMWVGLNEVTDGETMKGIQRMVPKFLRDGLKTWEYSQHGVLDRNGEPILEQLTPGQKFWQGAGFAPADISEGYAAKGAIMGARSRIQRRRQMLLNQLDRAARTDDQRLYQKTMAEIDRYNEVQRSKGKDYHWALLRRENIRRSLSQRARRREESEQAVWLPQTQLGMRELGRFALH